MCAIVQEMNARMEVPKHVLRARRPRTRWARTYTTSWARCSRLSRLRAAHTHVHLRMYLQYVRVYNRHRQQSNTPACSGLHMSMPHMSCRGSAQGPQSSMYFCTPIPQYHYCLLL